MGPVIPEASPRGARAPGRSLLQVLVVVLCCLLLGVAIGALGTVVHRKHVLDWFPLGIVLALAATLTAGVLSRAWGRMSGLLGYGVGWLVVVQLMALEGPGGDVLIPSVDKIGYVWSYAGLAIVAVCAFLPSQWFSDEPRPVRAGKAPVDPR
ncbi:hypothetical protein Slu03_20310 [Sediminihabitans luteus]|nr:hypothetical protein Slu03_20310 [Sediminihabitans luteus]